MTEENAKDHQTVTTALLDFGPLPIPVENAGSDAKRRFLEFFTVTIRNKNTRQAYAQALKQFFDWCVARSLFKLEMIEPMAVAAYIEHHQASPPTVKQHLAAIRRLFDWLVSGHVIRHNPAASVRGPTYVVKRGKTAVLTADEARVLLNSIDTSNIIGLRDKAIIGTMVYTFARVSATILMAVEDYYQEGKRWWFRFHEKGGKRHEVPAHHKAEAYVDAYLEAARLIAEPTSPLFRTVDRHGSLTNRRLSRGDTLRMIKRRAKAAGLSPSTCCHTFRATGITAFLENGGTIEKAQVIADHESPRTTKLYDRTNDKVTLDEVEKIAI